MHYNKKGYKLWKDSITKVKVDLIHIMVPFWKSGKQRIEDNIVFGVTQFGKV